MKQVTPVRSRTGATVVAAGLVGAVLAPIVNQFRDAPRDSFPLSHYPMFSARRGEHLRVAFVRGVRADGSIVVLDSRLAARGGMNQERKQIAARARRRRRASSLAARVACRIKRRGIHPDVVAVEVVRGRFSIADYFKSGPVEPVDVEVRARADIPGRSEPQNTASAPRQEAERRIESIPETLP